MSGELQISINKWDEYNPRKDIKNPSWLRFENDFFFSAKLFDLDNEERLAWIFLLCHASSKNQPTFVLTAEYVASFSRVPITKVNSAIKKLETKQCITVTRTEPVQTCTQSAGNLTLRNETVRYETERDETERVRTRTSAPASRPEVLTPHQSLTLEIWDSYKAAYQKRYQTQPVRNAAVNAQIKQLAARLGREAPDVVEFFVKHNQVFYVRSCHPIGICLKDAEALRTQWATGRSTGLVKAHNAELIEKIMQEEREEAEHGKQG